MKWTMIQMSLKKHSLYNLNWSCFKHTVPCANVKPCCIVLQLYMYLFEKLSRNQSWVNLLFSDLRDSILDAILDSLFLIRAGIKNPESSQESRLATDCQLTFERFCNRQAIKREGYSHNYDKLSKNNTLSMKILTREFRRTREYSVYPLIQCMSDQ